ncbi:cellulose biosynthesis cyclic di-GMP-binding regulatory protein BcsB [Citreimonas salinaria]|uniref:Cyclic di-GMP-binding protein n=1 Tax=Citreimonas salinaria TaxID=321339 RepID=A0A1H3MQN1_9RHOB|nr:cellulose biosynthesis cyclic di-GMP-binding regulatory protein BcsB [Citreimonas salinaria]SDY78794.1 cellulose synthase subunit [Citreimonas salinaria]
MMRRAVALMAIVAGLASQAGAQPLLPDDTPPAAPALQAPAAGTAETQLGLSAPVTDMIVPLVDGAGRGRQAAETDDTASGSRAETVLVRLRELQNRQRTATVAEFVGEWTQKDFSFTLPALPEAPVPFQLSHVSSVNALPDSSFIRVEVNGQPVRELPIRSFEDYRLDRFSIDPALLRVGDNRVRISVRQTHRIYCGVEAAFQLWTRVDLEASGLAVPNGTFRADFDGFIAGLASHVARGEPVPIRHDLSAPIADRITPLFSVLRRAVNGDILLLEEQSAWQVKPGPNVSARVSIIDDPRVRGVSFRRGGDGTLVMVQGSSVDFAEAADMLQGMLAGRVAVPPVPQVTPGTAKPLAELTQTDLVAHGRYIAMRVSFRLPNDWMLLANQKARLDLDYRFAPALPRGALLQIKVNGKTVRLLPLDRDGGRELPTLPVSMPTNVLRAGQNTLLFEALIPGDPPHAPCPVVNTPLVEILPTSRFFVPASPRMSVLDLDHALAALTASDVLLTESAQRSLAPGAHVMLASVFGGTKAETPTLGTPKVTVGVPGDIALLSPFYSDSALQAMGNAMRSLPPPSSGSGEMPVAWSDNAGSAADGAMTRVMQMFSQLQTGFLSFSGETYTSTTELPAWLRARSADAILVQPDPALPEQVWLFVNPDLDLRALASSLANRLYVDDGPRGQIALFTAGTGWENWSTTAKILYLLEPVTPGNFLAVAGNFATAYPWIFVFMLIFITIAASLVSVVLVLNRRRDNT